MPGASYRGSPDELYKCIDKYLVSAATIKPYAKGKTKSKEIVRHIKMWGECHDLQKTLVFRITTWRAALRKVVKKFALTPEEEIDYVDQVSKRLKLMARSIQQNQKGSKITGWVQAMPWVEVAPAPATRAKRKREAVAVSAASEEGDGEGVEEEDEEEEEEEEEETEQEESEEEETLPDAQPLGSLPPETGALDSFPDTLPDAPSSSAPSSSAPSSSTGIKGQSEAYYDRQQLKAYRQVIYGNKGQGKMVQYTDKLKIDLDVDPKFVIGEFKSGNQNICVPLKNYTIAEYQERQKDTKKQWSGTQASTGLPFRLSAEKQKSDPEHPKIILWQGAAQKAQCLSRHAASFDDAWDTMVKLAEQFCDDTITLEELKSQKPARAPPAKAAPAAKAAAAVAPAAKAPPATAAASSKAPPPAAPAAKSAPKAGMWGLAAMTPPRKDEFVFDDLGEWEWDTVELPSDLLLYYRHPPASR